MYACNYVVFNFKRYYVEESDSGLYKKKKISSLFNFRVGNRDRSTIDTYFIKI